MVSPTLACASTLDVPASSDTALTSRELAVIRGKQLNNTLSGFFAGPHASMMLLCCLPLAGLPRAESQGCNNIIRSLETLFTVV